MTQKVIIIGGHGYIGKNLATDLMSDGYKVNALSRQDVDLLSPTGSAKLAKFIDNDTYVLNLAAITRGKEDTINSCFLNVEIFKTILEAIEISPPQGFIQFSAADVYGHEGTNLKEHQAGNTQNTYGAFKFFVEKLLQAHEGKYLKTVFRFPGVFGGQNAQSSLVSRFANAIKNNQEITLHNNGESLRDFVSTSLLASVTKEVINQKIEGTFNIACNDKLSIAELVNLVSQELDCHVNLTLQSDKTERDFDQTLDTSSILTKIPDLKKYTLRNEIARALKNI